jgi:hypothetical protein
MTDKRTAVHYLVAEDLVVGASGNQGDNVTLKKRRPRQPTLASAIKQAEKTGKTVSSVTTAEGVTLHFGEAQTDQLNDLDKWLAKRNAH